MPPSPSEDHHSTTTTTNGNNTTTPIATTVLTTITTMDEEEMSVEPQKAGKIAAEEEEAGVVSPSSDILYTVEEVPPWYLTIFLALQHYLTLAGGTIAVPILVATFLCIAPDDPARGALVSTIFFHCGIVTLLQTTFGVRLPIIQSGDFGYVIPTIALLTTVHPPCSELPLANMTATEVTEEWQSRMRDVQGAITVASLVQILLGFTGLLGVLLRFITPLTVCPTVALVGLSLFDVAAHKASQHWGIAIMTIVIMALCSQYLSGVAVPIPVLNRKFKLSFLRIRIFMCYPVLMAVMVGWAVCFVLTYCDVLPPGSPARTDAAGDLITQAPWFTIPYPGQWGWPTVKLAGVVGMLGAVAASVIESVGDYYVCARMTGAPPPPSSAINRGIGIEGLGTLLGGLLGTGNGTTSSSQNIGLIGFTKVGSRRVVQVAAMILILSGVFGKFGATFVTVPEPVVAGVFAVNFAMISAIGISILHYVDLTSSRNLFVLGFSLFFGLTIPKWISEHPSAIVTGEVLLDQVLTVLLQLPMFVGGVLGFFLDHTIPGTPKERGLLAWNLHLNTRVRGEHVTNCYDLPWGMGPIQRSSWTRYLPFSPTFPGFTALGNRTHVTRTTNGKV